MVCFMVLQMISKCVGLVIVIREEMLMIERALVAFFSLPRHCCVFLEFKKKSIVNLSTWEAEYVATVSCVYHAIWLRRLLKSLKFE